jgi:hypothetical protein
MRGFNAFDIVWNKVALRDGIKGDPFALLLRRGAFDSTAEEALLRQSCCGGERPDVSGAISASSSPGTKWQVLRSDGDLVHVPLLPDARERVADALRAGQVVVMPGVDAAQAGWWTIDPATGQTLFIGSHGWGQTLTEQAKLAWAVATVEIEGWVPLVVKLVALSVCIMTNVSTAQVADPAHKTAATVGFVAGTGICIVAAVAGIGSMAFTAEESLLPRLVGIMAEMLGLGIEALHHMVESADEQIEATREGVKEKK